MSGRRVCRYCRSERIVPIVWGMPTADDTNEDKEELVALGGCVVVTDSDGYVASHRSLACGKDQGKRKLDE